MIFQQVRTRVRNDWDEPSVISLIESILDAFEAHPDHYYDSYSSLYTIQNIFASNEELLSHPQFQSNLIKAVDYLVSDSVGVLSLSYSIESPEGLMSITPEELREAVEQGFYVFENGESIENLNDYVVITFGLSKTFYNESK